MEEEPEQSTSSGSSAQEPAEPTNERPPFRPLYDLIVDMEGGRSEEQRRVHAEAVCDPEDSALPSEAAADKPIAPRPPFRPLYDLIVDMEGGPSEDQRRKRFRK